MYMTLFCEWDVIDASRGVNDNKTTIQPGRHAVERIPNPVELTDDWIVLKGTLIGGASFFWEGRSDESYGNARVVIEEEPRLDGPAALSAMSQDIDVQKMPWEEV